MNTDVVNTILLVEDDAIISRSQKKLLEDYGYVVITANTGEKAIETFNRNSTIKLILMDIDLGRGLDGPTTAKSILANREIPVIFLSNHTSPDVVGKTEKITSYGYVVKDSGITVLDASIKMAFKLFEANEKIRKSEELYLTVINSTDDLIWSVDKDLYLVTANAAFLDRLKVFNAYDMKPGDYVLNSEVFSTELIDLWTGLYAEVLSGKIVQRELNHSLNSSRPPYWVELHLHPIYQSAEIVGVACFSRHISERKIAEDKIRQMRILLEASNDGAKDMIIVMVDREYKYLYFNSANRLGMLNAYGVDVQLGVNLHDYIPKTDAETSIRNFDRALAGENHTTIDEYGVLDRSTFETHYGPIYNEKKEVIGASAFSSNITERRKAEETIKSLLAEKELILKEVHHRVKNNMNVVKSILNLQADKLDDPISQAALVDASNRVQSMMVIYDKLYNSIGIKNTSLLNYLAPLVDEIVANFPNREKIIIEKNIDDIEISLKKMQPLGIIINELLTNIFKHAFIDRTSGRITLNAKRAGSLFVLSIEDNGNGLPDEIDFKKSTGFGLVLVGLLAEQLDGDIRFERQNGTKFLLEFEL